MLPHLIGLNRDAPVPVAVPPPKGFQVPLLPIKFANLVSGRLSGRGATEAQKNGLRYERKAQDYLRRMFGVYFYDQPSIAFEDQRGQGIAIPDGLAVGEDFAAIFELKFQHMPESWWQLRRKYEPLVQWMWPQSRIVLVEVCASIDPEMPYPERFEIVEDLEAYVAEAPSGALGVFQWKS